MGNPWALQREPASSTGAVVSGIPIHCSDCSSTNCCMTSLPDMGPEPFERWTLVLVGLFLLALVLWPLYGLANIVT